MENLENNFKKIPTEKASLIEECQPSVDKRTLDHQDVLQGIKESFDEESKQISKAEENFINANIHQIDKNYQELDDAINNENYEKARKIKNEIDKNSQRLSF